MANKLKSIKQTKKIDDMTSLDILFSFILGDNIPRKFDDHKVYNEGDCIIHYYNGKYRVFRCLTNVYGKLNINTDWAEINLYELIRSGDVDTHSTEQIIISDVQPTSKSNKIWYQTLGSKTINIGGIIMPQKDIDKLIIFDADGIKLQDEEPEDDNTTLWFDTDGEPVPINQEI